MSEGLVLIGSAGHAGVVLEAALSSGVRVCGVLAPESLAGTEVHGLPVLGGDEKLNERDFVQRYTFIVALGSQSLRRSLSETVLAAGGRLQTIVHPSAYVSANSLIGDGSFIAAGAIIGVNARLGQYVIVNTAASVDHDCVIEDGVQICPGARLAGHVVCESYAFIGTGAVVIPRLTLGANSIIGAGAVVVRSVPKSVTVVGNPAVVLSL